MVFSNFGRVLMYQAWLATVQLSLSLSCKDPDSLLRRAWRSQTESLMETYLIRFSVISFCQRSCQSCQSLSLSLAAEIAISDRDIMFSRLNCFKYQSPIGRMNSLNQGPRGVQCLARVWNTRAICLSVQLARLALSMAACWAVLVNLSMWPQSSLKTEILWQSSEGMVSLFVENFLKNLNILNIMKKDVQKDKDCKGFKPLKPIEKGSKGYHLKQIAQMTLGSGNMSLAVELPTGEDLNEWLAVNIIEFYNEISILYGTLTEYCTKESCPVMSAGPRYEYHWADNVITTPVKVPANQYIEYLMTWVQAQLSNESIFPCSIGVPFPKSFLQKVKKIFQRLFRVYAHIYHSHFQHILLLGLEYHLNTCFKHFVYFLDEFKLVSDGDLAPLSELIQQFKMRKESV